MKFKALSLPDLEQVRQWRNECLEALRTPFLLTKEMQEEFYKDIICNRHANARYWGVWVDEKVTMSMVKPMPDVEVDGEIFIGMTGLENISWENRLAEISIMLNPGYHRKGYGKKAVELLLDQGFNYLNLENIYGECYACNPALIFWFKIIEKYNADIVLLPNRKYYNGQYFSGTYFNINKGAFLKHENPVLEPTQTPN